LFEGPQNSFAHTYDFVYTYSFANTYSFSHTYSFAHTYGLHIPTVSPIPMVLPTPKLLPTPTVLPTPTPSAASPSLELPPRPKSCYGPPSINLQSEASSQNPRAPSAVLAAQHLIREQHVMAADPPLSRLLPRLPHTLVSGMQQVGAFEVCVCVCVRVCVCVCVCVRVSACLLLLGLLVMFINSSISDERIVFLDQCHAVHSSRSQRHCPIIENFVTVLKSQI